LASFFIALLEDEDIALLTKNDDLVELSRVIFAELSCGSF